MYILESKYLYLTLLNFKALSQQLFLAEETELIVSEVGILGVILITYNERWNVGSKNWKRAEYTRSIGVSKIDDFLKVIKTH